jgi:hypothetical protein
LLPEFGAAFWRVICAAENSRFSTSFPGQWADNLASSNREREIVHVFLEETKT